MYIKSISARFPSASPLTVPCAVFIHHPTKFNSFARCCVNFRKKTSNSDQLLIIYNSTLNFPKYFKFDPN